MPSPRFRRRPTSRSQNTHRTAPNASRLVASLDELGRHPHRPAARHRRHPPDGRRRTRRRGAAAPPLRHTGHLHHRRALRRDRRHRSRHGGERRMGEHPVRRTRRGVPARRRSVGRAVAGEALRRNDARPVEVRLSGRDRRGLRADRLLAVQRRLRPADPGAAADQRPRCLEPHRLSAVGRLRLRHHAVQLHRDRGQPADRARVDGQHRGVEAVDRPRRSRPT